MSLANLLWLKLPEYTQQFTKLRNLCLQFKEDGLQNLAKLLVKDEEDWANIEAVLVELKSLPLGVITKINDVRIVKVLKEK